MKKLFSVRTLILAGSLLLQLNTLCFHSRGAAGDVDLSFDPGSGVNGTVNAVVVQPDGKAIIGGEFTTVKGLERFKVARLNADGSGDTSFNPGASLAELANNSWAVYSMALQPDGKVLIGGEFIVGGFNGIARLNADGSLDTSFSPTEIQASVVSLALQSDGKVLIGGGVTVGGTNNTGVVRLNANGSFDTSFNSSAGGFYSVLSLALQPDGRVLIGDGSTFRRLNSNGSLDGSFNPGTGDGVRSVALQADGKMLIGGWFSSVNGTNRNGIARLNANGSLDSSFDPGTGAYSDVRSVALQSDGKVLIAGYFTTAGGTNRAAIARLNANGSLDSAFNPSTEANRTVNSVVVQSDGKVLIGGDFTTVNGTNRNRMARLNANGSLDGSFDPGRGIESYVSSLVMQSDGRVLIGGPLTFINGTNRYGSARLNADGSLDSTFIPNSFNPNIGVIGTDYSGAESLVVQSDGKALVGGYIATTVEIDEDGNHYYSFGCFVTRVNADGSRDASFELAVGGYYSGWTGRDPWSPTVRALVVQPDGKVVVGGIFSSIKGTNRSGIARLNSNGSLDNGFNAGTGNYFSVCSVALQSDGKVIIGGSAAYVNGTNRGGIARLNANGSLDSSFNPGTGANGTVWSVALQPDGKVLIGGSFTSVNGTNRNRIARLNADGSLDNSFNPGTGADGLVRSIALQSDGKMLIGGDFTTVNGVVRPYVARLYGDSVTPSLNIARSNAFVIVSWPSPSTGFVLQQNTDLKKTNWTTPSETVADNGTTKSITVSPAPGNRFYRLFKP